MARTDDEGRSENMEDLWAAVEDVERAQSMKVRQLISLMEIGPVMGWLERPPLAEIESYQRWAFVQRDAGR